MIKNGKRVTGGHSLVKGNVRISKIIDSPDINGVYNAEVEIYNPKTQKWEIKVTKDGNRNTMYPVDWTEERIIEEIKSAWDNDNFKIEVNDTGKNWSGISKSGLPMNGFINKERVTAFPLYKGGEVK